MACWQFKQFFLQFWLLTIIINKRLILIQYRLADKSRFSYDGLKRQRLVTPMLRDNTGELKPVDWEAALLTVAKVVKNAGNYTN